MRKSDAPPQEFSPPDCGMPTHKNTTGKKLAIQTANNNMYC